MALVCLVAGFGPASAGAADATSDFTLSGSVRLRYETLSGQARAGLSANDDLVSIRTKLFAEYRPGPFRFGAELYDSRAYGGNAAGAVSANDVNAFELIQAYIGFNLGEPFGADTKASAQAGRVVLDIGSRRLVGGPQYRNTTNAFTGLRTDFSWGNDLSATLLYVLPQIRLPNDKPSVLKNAIAFDRESFNLVLWGGILTKTRAIGDASFDLTYFHLGEHDSPHLPTPNRSLETVGSRVIRDPGPGKFDYEAEAIYQFGTIRNGLAQNAAQLDVSAGFVHVDAGYTSAGPWQPRISLAIDYASGDGSGRNYNRFDTLFGTRRADFGPSGIYSDIGRSNIIAPTLRIDATPNARLDWFVNYRLLWLASATDAFSTTGVIDRTGQARSFAGQQIEARVRYWILPAALQFEADAAFLIKGRFLKTAPNASTTGNTRYASLSLIAYF